MSHTATSVQPNYSWDTIIPSTHRGFASLTSVGSAKSKALHEQVVYNSTPEDTPYPLPSHRSRIGYQRGYRTSRSAYTAPNRRSCDLAHLFSTLDESNFRSRLVRRSSLFRLRTTIPADRFSGSIVRVLSIDYLSFRNPHRFATGLRRNDFTRSTRRSALESHTRPQCNVTLRLSLTFPLPDVPLL